MNLFTVENSWLLAVCVITLAVAAAGLVSHLCLSYISKVTWRPLNAPTQQLMHSYLQAVFDFVPMLLIFDILQG